MRKQFMKKNQGFILLVVLSILASMVILVVNLVETVNTERQLSQDYSHKVRSQMLARSGIQYAAATMGRNVYDTKKISNFEVSVGRGTYGLDGDIFTLSAQDTTGMINVNDGIAAGTAESTTDEYSDSWIYEPNKLDPWHEGTGVTIDETIPQVDKSGLINLRIRRLLNAYGYAHKYKDSVDYESNSSVDLSSFEFTSNATSNEGETAASGARGVSAPFDENALGDQIISNRLSLTGYSELREIKNIVNNWAVDNLSSNYVADAGFSTFYNMVTGDLTCKSFEDTNFYRLRTEIAATADLTVGGSNFPHPVPDEVIKQGFHTSNKEFPCMWWYQNDHTDPRFHPNYLDIHPIDLTDDSGNLTFDKDGQLIENEKNMWLNHSVALINLNSASDLVRAAVFYAPVNVSYLCEGAVTHTTNIQEQAKNEDWGNLGSDRSRQPNISEHDDSIAHLNWNNVSDRGNARNSIGVRGPHFNSDRMTEGGNDTDGKVQKNRLMSLRDALTLAEAYGEAISAEAGLLAHEIYNFEDFKNYLTFYRKNRRKELGLTNLKKPVYERSEVIPLEEADTGMYKIKFVTSTIMGKKYEEEDCVLQYRDNTSKTPKLFRAVFMDKDNPEDTEPMWVSQFWPENPSANNYRDKKNKAQWEGGWFLEDYVERTLPHIFSSVRRLPGYLGAPMALTSPYMAIEPWSAISPNWDPTKNRGKANLPRTADLRRAKWYKDDEHLKIDKSDGISVSAQAYLGRLPKINVEDFVTRHTLPKVCFLANGYYNVQAIGRVKSPKGRIVSQTTISTLMQTFETKYYRTQADFVGLLNRDNSGEILMSDDPEQGVETHTGVVIGPEFKFNNRAIEGGSSPNSYTNGDEIGYDQRVHSKYLVSLGIADANSMSESRTSDPKDGLPAGHGSVKAWDLFLEGDPRDVEGGLNQSLNVPTILPSYGTDDWHAMTMIDPRQSHSGNGKLYTPYRSNHVVGASDVWYGGFNKSITNGDNGKGNLPTSNIASLYHPSAFEDVSDNMSTSSSDEEFARKWQSRMFIPRGSNLKSLEESGDMEGAFENLWAQKDGHDLDPFSSGIFFGASGNGEYADKYYNPYDQPYMSGRKGTDLDMYPYVQEPSYTGRHTPKTYRDTMYWNLNNKLKNFNKTAKVSNGKVLLSNNDSDNNGVMDIYDIDVNLWEYDDKNGDTNPVGVSFHRGFMGAWFRVPTSYPFAHNTGNYNQTHHQLYKCIMNLHLLNNVSSDGDDNDIELLPKAREVDDDPNPYPLCKEFDPSTPTVRMQDLFSLHQPQAFWEYHDSKKKNYGIRFSKFYPTSIDGNRVWGHNNNQARDDKDGLDGTKRLAPYTMHHEVDVQVGYYSGLDSDDFGFTHGIVGNYNPSFVWGGVGVRGLSSTRHYGSNAVAGHMHPLSLSGLTSARNLFGDPRHYDDINRKFDYDAAYAPYDPQVGVDLTDTKGYDRQKTYQVLGHKTPSTGNPYYGNVHGYMYDYDHMLPTPFDFRGWSKLRNHISNSPGIGVTTEEAAWGFDLRHAPDSSPHNDPGKLEGGANDGSLGGAPYYAPEWLANVNTDDLGIPVNYASDATRFNLDAYPGNDERTYVPSDSDAPRSKFKNLIYGPSNARNVPFMHAMWRHFEDPRNRDSIDKYMAYRDYEIDTVDNMPLNRMMYASHADYQMYNSYKVTIEHKIPMNISAECAPGSWHRVYAFWFMRFNPGSMGAGVKGGLPEQGDSKICSNPNSNVWGPEYKAEKAGGYYANTFPATSSKYADFVEPANDVDGLDQFGIWFRDDSNYTELFEKMGQGSGALKALIKPRFRVYRMTRDEGASMANNEIQDEFVNGSNPRVWEPDGIQDVEIDEITGEEIKLWEEGGRQFRNIDEMYNFSNAHPNIHLSIGSVHTGYDMKKGFRRFTGEGADEDYYPSKEYYHDYDRLRRRYPAHIFNSTIDDVIFGYGPDISNAGTFDGLFHNARWLADANIDVSDEVRYDIDPTDSKKQPQIIFDPMNDEDMSEGVTIVHVGTRIYHPRDSGNDHDNKGVPERYNYSEVRLDLFSDGNKMVDVPSGDHTPFYNRSSKNYQDHFFNDLIASNSDDVKIQLKYTGYQRRHDNQYETVADNEVITESLYRNYGQTNGGSEYEWEGGDSFTNLSHVQEISIRYRKPGGIRFFFWKE